MSRRGAALQAARRGCGKLEGLNNKVGAMTRAAYGYRAEEFLHLKLYSLHESSLRFTGI